MARWEPDARGRLERAALDLFAERGFDQTTVTEIAERAGLTKRTFFNHFTDKREVLFGGHDLLQEVYRDAIAGAPASATPIDLLTAGLHAAADLHEQRPDVVRLRASVVGAHPMLQERDLLKRSTVAGTVRGALRERGVDEPTARLLGEIGPAVFRVAFAQWVTDEAQDGRLAALVDEALTRLLGLGERAAAESAG